MYAPKREAVALETTSIDAMISSHNVGNGRPGCHDLFSAAKIQFFRRFSGDMPSIVTCTTGMATSLHHA
jgi:hypothetical protein